MLLATAPKLPDEIVARFLETPVVTAAELHGRLNATFRSVSLVSVYSELNKLAEQGVVVKEGKNFRLSFHWILSLSHFSEALYSRYLAPDLLQSVLPAPGESVRWNFSTLRRMDIFWVQLFFLLFSRSPTRVLYEWAPHGWFSFLDVEIQRQYMQLHRRENFRVFMIVGSDNFLNRAAAASWDPQTYTWSFAPGPFAGDPHYYSVIDDFVITVTLEPAAVRKLDGLFERVQKMSDLNLIGLSRIVDGPSRSRIQLENKAPKAKRMRRKFRDYFGLRDGEA